MANIIKEARYIMCDTSNNNNKYWYAFLYDDGVFETQWNRVGEAPQKTIKQGCTEAQFNSKCREKEKKGYKILDTLADAGVVTTSNFSNRNIESAKLEKVAKEQIKHNDPIVEKLIVKLTTANVHSIMESTKLTYNTDTGLFSTPLGIVTQNTVNEARDLLTKIGDFIVKNDTNNEAYKQLFNDYCMHIPQDIGRKKLSPDLVFPDVNAVQSQNSILDSLEVSIQSVLDGIKVTNDTEEVELPQVFKTKLELIEDGKIIDRIMKKVHSTIQSSHASSHLRIKTIYSVDISDMRDAFETKGKTIGNCLELIHGTRISNVLSILQKGLVIPPATASYVCGRLYGNGCYFANKSSKAVNYSYGYWDNKTKDNNCYAFLADVALGKSYTPKNTYESLPKPGYDSTFAKAGISGVMNDEIIVYNTYQCNLTYMMEFTPGGK